MLYNNFIDKHDLHLNKAWIRKKRSDYPSPPQKKSCFLFFTCLFLPRRVFFVFFFSVFVFSFLLFIYFLFFADCFLLFFKLLSFFFCFSVFVCASFCAFFCWNQSCWFLRTSPVLVKINCLDLRCVKHIGLTDTPLSQHDFLRCFVTVVLRNFPRWHRDGLRQRQDRGFLSLKSLKQLGSWRQKHGMEEEIPGLEFEGVHHVQLPFFC